MILSRKFISFHTYPRGCWGDGRRREESVRTDHAKEGAFELTTFLPPFPLSFLSCGFTARTESKSTVTSSLPRSSRDTSLTDVSPQTQRPNRKRNELKAHPPASSPSLPVVKSVEEASDTAYAFVIITTKSLPDILPTEAMLEPIIKAGKSKTFVLIQNGLGIEEGIYAATRGIDATILTSVCYISTNLVGNRDEVRFEVSSAFSVPLAPSLARKDRTKDAILTSSLPRFFAFLTVEHRASGDRSLPPSFGRKDLGYSSSQAYGRPNRCSQPVR